LHVLFLPSWYPSSPDDLSGSFFREQAIALAESGADVGVIAPSLRSLRNPLSALGGDNGVRRENDQGVNTYRASIPHLTPRLMGPTFRRVGKLTERIFAAYLADHGAPDVLHVHAALPIAEGAVSISKKYGVPLVYSEHSSAFARNLVGPAGAAAARKLAMHAIRRFTVSTPFASFLEQNLGLAADFFDVMPNQVQSGFLTHELALPVHGQIRFLHISLLDSQKNVPVLLQAFANRFRGKDEVTLVIGGDGPTRAPLVQLAQTLGIDSQVTFLGKLSRTDVVAALSKADVFILPSKFETFGVVLIEALAMGVPVIATRCGGPEDIVKKEDGLLVPVDDIAELAGAMTQFATPSLLSERAARRERCRQRFGADCLTGQWLDIYVDAVGRQRGQR